MKTLIRAALLLACNIQADAGLLPDEREAIEAELRAPITLLLKNRQHITGNPVSVSKDQIQIASAQGAGEIVFTFNREEIDTIEIPGERYKSQALEWIESHPSSARDLMDLLYRQRGPILPILPAGESNFFILYVELILHSPNPARAIGVSTRLRPQIDNPAALRALDDAILESYHRLELFENALPLAQSWIKERRPYGESALGYYVLGSHYLRHAAFESALDLALQPIVFASPRPANKLAHCYALAVSAALELREPEHAALLFREMEARGFDWPANDSTLESYLDKMNQYIADHEAD
ncbi:MAG: hypothetical protein ACPG3X_07230 [Opitutales bacterium]